jgi:hypothetical protein
MVEGKKLESIRVNMTKVMSHSRHEINKKNIIAKERPIKK